MKDGEIWVIEQKEEGGWGILTWFESEEAAKELIRWNPNKYRVVKYVRQEEKDGI